MSTLIGQGRNNERDILRDGVVPVDFGRLGQKDLRAETPGNAPDVRETREHLLCYAGHRYTRFWHRFFYVAKPMSGSDFYSIEWCTINSTSKSVKICIEQVEHSSHQPLNVGQY